MRGKTQNASYDGWSGPVVASDESGFGSWAGPLVVCAATTTATDWDDPRIRDSKAFKGEKNRLHRAALYDEYVNDPRFRFAIEVVSAEAIDRRGVYPMLLAAHEAALKAIGTPDMLGVVDGKFPTHKFDLTFTAVSFPRADDLVPECSLASIIAKVTHDRMMVAYDKEYPGYGFATNVGYGGSAAHDAGLEKLGPCPIHRTSYRPIAKMIAERTAPPQPAPWELLDGD